MTIYWSKLFDIPRIEVIQFLMWGRGLNIFFQMSPQEDVFFYSMLTWVYLQEFKKTVNTDFKTKEQEGFLV